MIQERLLSIVNAYNSDSYYKYGGIPPKKLQAAMQHYPVDPSDTPLALIDTTVLGSAKTGMVIGLKGVYLKNDWTTKTDRNFIPWDLLANSHSSVGLGKMSCVLVYPGCEINMSGSSMKKDLLVNLLNQLISLYKELANSQQNVNPAPECRTVEVAEVIVPRSLPSSNNSDAYQEIVPEIIALCMTADGEIEEAEVELGSALIESDELIVDKQKALESMSLNIDKLIQEKQKSNAIYKLKATTIISKIVKISDSTQKERIMVILEGMLDCVGSEGESETKKLIEMISSKIQK